MQKMASEKIERMNCVIKQTSKKDLNVVIFSVLLRYFLKHTGKMKILP